MHRMVYSSARRRQRHQIHYERISQIEEDNRKLDKNYWKIKNRARWNNSKVQEKGIRTAQVSCQDVQRGGKSLKVRSIHQRWNDKTFRGRERGLEKRFENSKLLSKIAYYVCPVLES